MKDWSRFFRSVDRRTPTAARLKSEIRARLGTHRVVHIPGPKPGEFVKPRIRVKARSVYICCYVCNQRFSCKSRRRCAASVLMRRLRHA